MSIPEITTTRHWSMEDVRSACVRNKFYTQGTCEQYDAMLDYVDGAEPTPENIYIVAKNICEHSENQTITNIMFILEREAVITLYFLDGSDEV